MNNQKGQALPMAILALAIGALVVVPFLSHAGTSILSSRVYAEEIGSRTASDAGVEHAIWSLKNGTLAEQIPGPGDQIIYQVTEPLNGVTPTVTVTTDAIASGIVGDIDTPVIDSLIFDNTFCNIPGIINVSGNIYAIAYQGPSSDGFLKTVEIAPDGIITNSAIDTLEFDIADCVNPDIIHISGDTFAIAYTGSQGDGFLRTVTINAAGTIGNTVIDTFEFDTADGNDPDIVFVSGDYYAIAYRGQASDGFLRTMTINAAGAIGNFITDTLEFDPGNCLQPDIENVAGSIFQIAYQGASADGFLKSVSIAANGNIGNSVIDTIEFNTADCAYPDIIHISGDVYAIAYTGSGNDGFLTTMTVTAAGVISNNTIATFEFDNANGLEPRIIYLSGNIYAVVYDGPQNDGWIITLPVETNGTIPGTVIDSFEYDTGNGNFPSVLLISDGVLAVAYCNPSSRGSLATIGINTDPGVDSYEIRSAAGGIIIRALININPDTRVTTITSWSVQ